MSENYEVVLKRAVQAQPVAADFEVIGKPVPDPADGQLLVRCVYQSLDPYIGSRLRNKHMGEAAPQPGSALPGFSVGEVLRSRHPDIAKGDYVVGECGWTNFGLMAGNAVRKVDATLPLAAHLGVLGMPGLTAWAGVTQLAQVGPGDIFVVDAAAGSVGGTAGQIARNLGARALGIAGGAAKCAQVAGIYGFHACVDYHQAGWPDQLKELAGAGPTVHFENVGTSLLLPVLKLLQLYGRVVLCGLAEHYQSDAPPPEMPVGIIVGKRAKLMGLVVYDYYARWSEWVELARPWLADGRLVSGEDIVDGIPAAPDQFERLMRGQNVGKSLVRLGPDRG
jgi:NADPH-dependent curcumin reductase CurA